MFKRKNHESFYFFMRYEISHHEKIQNSETLIVADDLNFDNKVFSRYFDWIFNKSTKMTQLTIISESTKDEGGLLLPFSLSKW